MGKLGAHDTLETRRKKQKSHLARTGSSETRPAEMLDLFLSGERVVEIARAYGISVERVRAAISLEALFRLMEQRKVEMLQDITEMMK